MQIIYPKKRVSQMFVGVGATLLLILISLVRPATHLVEGANITSAKDTLQSSRISFAGRVDSTGTTVGSSVVKLKNTSSAPYFSITTANLKAGDSITINANTYTIVGILDTLNFTVTPVLVSGDGTDASPIRLRSKPQHVVSFVTASAVVNGSFRILLPADTTTPNDGNPDDEGFDFNTSPAVTASNVTGYTFGTGVSIAAGAAGCTVPANYHCFDIPYTGAGAIGTTITINIGNTNGTNTPIAPAPGNTTLGTAETYPFIVRNYNGALPGSSTMVDTSSGRIAFLEGVRVTATVDPTLSMTICGDTTCNDVNPGDVVDGETLSSNTGATSSETSVALGVLDLLNPRLEAQKITVATNSNNGYALTALDDGNLRKGADDINDNVTPPTAPAVLNSVGTEAYGIHPSGSHVNTTTWGTGSAAANKYSGTDASTAVTLATNSAPAAGVATYVTYKANIGATTAQGDYEHAVFYTATATF